MNKPVPEWGRTLDEADFPHEYFGTFGAIVVNTLSLIMPHFIVSGICYVAAELYIPEPK